MLTKTKIALTAALILSPATAVLAADLEQSYGGATQTWQDIERSGKYIQDQIKSEYHTGNAGAAYGYAKPAKPAHHVETSQDK